MPRETDTGSEAVATKVESITSDAATQSAIASLRAENEQQRQMIAELTKKLDEQNRTIESMQAQLRKHSESTAQPSGKPKSQRPPLGPLTNEAVEFERKTKKSKRDYVMENKLRVLKENMKKGGHGEIVDMAEYGGGPMEKLPPALRASLEGGKHHSLAELDGVLPRSALPWNSGAVGTQNRKFKNLENRKRLAKASGESTSLPPIQERGRMPARDVAPKVPITSKSSDVKSSKVEKLKALRAVHKEAARTGRHDNASAAEEKPASRGTNDDLMNVIDQSEPSADPLEAKGSKPISFADRRLKDFEKQKKSIHLSKIEQLKFKMKMQN